MKVESIELRNFCQHASLEAELSDGLTAVIGPNGSGKSNVLGGIRYALLGENPNVGRLADNIRDISPESEPSFVRVGFRHGGTRAIVQRNLRPDKPTATLEILETGEVIEGASKVNARVISILGIGADILNDMVIVAQNDIFGFLDKTPAKRAEAFQRLFHTEKAEKLYRDLGEHLRKLEIPSVGCDLDELRGSRRQSQERKEELAATLSEELMTFEEIAERRNADEELIRHYNQMEELSQQLRIYQERLGILRREEGELKSHRDAAAAERDTISSAIEGNRKKTEKAQSILENLSEWRRLEKEKASVFEDLQATNTFLARMAAPPEPPENFSEDFQGLLEELARLREQQAQDEKLLNAFAAGESECPTCGTPTTNLQPVIEAAESRRGELNAQCLELRDRYEACRLYVSQRDNYQNQLQLYQSRKRNLEEQLSRFPEKSVDEQLSQVPGEEQVPDEARLQEIVDRQRTLQEGLEEYNQAIQNYERELARVSGAGEQTRQHLTSLEERLAAVPRHTTEEMEAAIQRMPGWTQEENGRRDVSQELAVVEDRLGLLDAQIQQAERVAVRAAALRNWTERVTAWRDLLHKDAAPRFVAQQNLLRLQEGVNEYLQMFETDYRIQADEGLSFLARFARGSQQPAERLSEGQKVILALAFRIALNSMFAENIGALYLDEPTAYLDEHHIRGFEPVVDRLRDYSASRGLQVVMVTHERDLSPLFDQVIQL